MKKRISYLKDFQAMQIELQEKQMSGQEFSDEDAAKAQEMAMKIQNRRSYQ